MQTVEYRKALERLPECLEEALPERLLEAVKTFGVSKIEEIRLCRDRFLSLTIDEKSRPTEYFVCKKELDEIFLALCKGSVYAHRETLRSGYLSPGEGVRVGVAGRALYEKGQVFGVKDLSGLVLRIPHPMQIPVENLLPYTEKGLLLYAPPGVGKTTLLRCLAVELSKMKRAVLLDPRGEFAGTLPSSDKHLGLQLLTAFPSALGLEAAVRNLGAQCILTDEIGNEAEAELILSSANCGIPFVATAHAKAADELYRRPAVRRLLEAGVFGYLAGLSRSRPGHFSYEITKGARL